MSDDIPTPITDFLCIGQESKEQPDGTFADIQSVMDVRKIFHPLQDPNDKAPVTNFRVQLEDGSIKDLNQLFEPLRNGKECPIPTQFEVNGVDLQKIFAGMNTLPVNLELVPLPAGAFTCNSRIRMVYDTSGSMNNALGHIRPAVYAVSKWFARTFGFQEIQREGGAFSSNPSAGGLQAYSTTNELCVGWLGENLGAHDSSTEVVIAYINESSPGGVGSAAGYINRWTAQTAAGGQRFGAIMGVVPSGGSYASQILSVISYRQKLNGRTLSDMGVSAFFDFFNSTPRGEHIRIIADWLNIPTKPQDLDVNTVAFESGEHEDKVQWDLSSVVCGLTQEPSPGFSNLKYAHGYYYRNQDHDHFYPTQKCWRYTVHKDTPDGPVVSFLEAHILYPRYTYNIQDEHKSSSEFYLQVTAVAMPYDSKFHSARHADKVFESVLCESKPVVSIPGVRPPLLEQNRVTGEGGYKADSYFYRCKTDILFKPGANHGPTGSLAKSSSYLPEIFNFQTHPDIWSKHTAGGIEYDVATGIVRVSTGNENVFVMQTDGTVSLPSYPTRNYPWISSNYTNFQDMFCPSDYNRNFTQLVLMSDGKLRSLRLLDKSAMADPPVVLTDVSRIMSVNQGHARDCIISRKDNTVWYVALDNGGTWFTERIPGMLAEDVKTISIGDDYSACRVVFKSDPKTAVRYGQYRTLVTVNNHVFQNAGIHTIKMSAPVGTVLYSPADRLFRFFGADEEIIEMQGNEVAMGVMTAKRLRIVQNTLTFDPMTGEALFGWYDTSWNSDETPLYLPVATAYSIIYVTSKRASTWVLGSPTHVDTGYFPIIQSGAPC